MGKRELDKPCPRWEESVVPAVRGTTMREPELSQQDQELLKEAISQRKAASFVPIDEEKMARDDSLVTFSVKLPASDIYALKVEARRNQVSVGELLRRFVRDGLGKREGRNLEDPAGLRAFLEALQEDLDELKKWSKCHRPPSFQRGSQLRKAK